MSFVVQPFTESDTEAADIVLRAAFKTSYGRKDNLRCYLQIQPSRAFVARKDEEIVGFGGAMDFGRFAYIGLMGVDPKVQRQGVGGMILRKDPGMARSPQLSDCFTRCQPLRRPPLRKIWIRGC